MIFGKKHSVFLLVSLQMQLISAMETPVDLAIPVTVTNNSSEIVVLFSPKGGIDCGQYREVYSDQKYIPNNDGTPLKIDLFGSVRLHSIGGAFCLSANKFNNTLVLEKLQGIMPGASLPCGEFLNPKFISECNITVDEQGLPHLSALFCKPNDGRPEASLLVYKKLVGSESYASPKQILGIENQHYDPKAVYQNKMLQWNRETNISSETVAACALIKWAAGQLGIQ